MLLFPVILCTVYRTVCLPPLLWKYKYSRQLALYTLLASCHVTVAGISRSFACLMAYACVFAFCAGPAVGNAPTPVQCSTSRFHLNVHATSHRTTTLIRDNTVPQLTRGTISPSRLFCLSFLAPPNTSWPKTGLRASLAHARLHLFQAVLCFRRPLLKYITPFSAFIFTSL